ncbi:alpha/beta hydrolase [Kribbella sandramycini]|uniref:Alpha/beta hydrolase n=1 Tax=Kribbella sandramycini TaxID=60450 RepID=A0A7Y4NYP3_9ACTN|nr:alpha/beta hydrolase [Kribbella sandramycini]MBB6568283.1 putative dienelactone hydrolase [Kribbella sandramycini]NOL39124.1 alpha/beta hydrolase [Kribbella sandramycini]
MASRGVRKVRTGIVILLLLVLVGGGGYAGWVLVQRSEPVGLPAPSGDLQVGRRTYDWTDNARRDPFSEGSRRLSVWVWYPVAKGVAARKVEYAPGQWGGLQAEKPWSMLQGQLDAVRDPALDKAAIAPGRFPVVTLLPAMGLSAPTYAALAEDLASHGYLVAGVTPTYSAKLTVIDGQTIESKPEASPGNLDDDGPGIQEAGDQLVATWAGDARFAAAQVAKQFPNSVNTTVGASYVGHGFGGAAALEACRTDARCAAAVDLDGRQFGQAVSKGVQAPIMLLGADDSCITSICGPDAKSDADRDTALSLLRASTNTSWCATIPDARHYNFTDYGVYYLAWPLRRTLPLGSADGARALTRQAGYLTTFLSHALFQTPAPGAPACPS